MTEAARARMTSAAFIAWAMQRPRGERWELVAGTPVAMAPERSAHALAKGMVFRRLAEAIEAAGLPCTAYPDGMAVTIDDATTYEPDALVRCGPPLPGDAVTITDPVIVVEVLSPSTRAVIAHPGLASGSTGSLAASTKRSTLSTEARLALAVLTTERKAA